jgi:high affinity sulfate transporter 1
LLRSTSLRSTDRLAGVAVAAVEIPTALAYAELAGFPPVVGLYASILPLIAYAIVGTSPQLIVGPDAATCALVAAALEPLAGGSPQHYLDLSITLSILVGVLCIAGGILRLGTIANFLSRPVLVGFLNGMALTIVSGQLGKLCGFAVRTDTGFFLRMADFVSKIPRTHFPTLIIGVITLVIIYAMGRLVPRLPSALVGVCGGIGMMVILDSEKWGVTTLGAVPAGFLWPHLPSTFLSDTVRLLPDAGGIALICFCGSMVTAKSFAARNGYEVAADREFVALGVANVTSGLSSGFPIAGTDSRTAINDLTGGRSQVSGLTAAVLMASVLTVCTGPLAYIPTASLGAVLVLAGASLFDFQTVWKMRDVSRSEFALSLIATLGVATIGVLPGIALTVMLSLILLIRRASSPYDAILGQVPGVDGFTDISEYPNAQLIPGLLIYRFDAALLFFNADYFKKRVRDVVTLSGQSLHLFVFDMEAINAIDMTGLEALEEIRSELATKEIAFIIARVKNEIRNKLTRSGFSERIGETFHPSVRSAVESALNESSRKSEHRLHEAVSV